MNEQRNNLKSDHDDGVDAAFMAEIEAVVPVIRPVSRSEPDLRKLARALIALAIAQNQPQLPPSDDNQPDTDDAGDGSAGEVSE